ncbi:chitobiase/beta-hexosaminidase C-terminal domain-containing protein [Myxococcus fulvus]|uniref:chitobiase/beta-hexosaminidase C-terminal domain-containing protein n=1 Tax=Myxococcus fulvus TaxID=33 RepID=UPI003B9D3FA5
MKDTTAPTTAVSPEGGLFKAPMAVTLTCDDGAGSGCAATHYTLDGSAPTTQSPRYTAPVRVEASATLRFFSVDREGNAEQARSAEFVVDAVAPTVTASPASGPQGTPYVVTLTCGDGGGSGCASIHYTLDGSVPSESSTRYQTPFMLSAGARVRFIALDRAGNASLEGLALYSIDTTGPFSAAMPTGGVFGGHTQVSLTCDDAGGTGCARIHYSLDGRAPTKDSPVYSGPLELTSTADVRFFSVDVAGNVGAQGLETYLIDTEAPTGFVSPPGGHFSSRQTVTLRCEDTGGSGCAAIHYTTDGTAPERTSPRYTQPLEFSSSTTLRFLVVDGVGHTWVSMPESYTIVLDRTAPTTVASPGGGVFRTPQLVTLTCEDTGGSGCADTWYTLDDSEPTPTTGRPYAGPFTLSSTTRLRFVSRDAAGNLGDSQLQVFTFDVSAPVTQAAPPGGSFNAPVTVSLTCTDSPAGCAETRYTLDGSAVTNTSPLYTGPFLVARTTSVTFRSVDTVGNQELSRRETYVVPDLSNTASEQISAVRASADGSLPMMPIDGAIVTFVKPGVGNLSNDGPGLFLQARKEGPALFVEVNPSVLTPTPVAGDWVRVRVSAIRSWNGMRRASLDIGSFAVRGRGFPVASLAQDVSGVDLPLQREQFDSELVSLSGVIAGPFSTSGTGHVQAPLVTTGVPTGSSSAAQLRLRVVATVNDALELTQGCEVSLTAPLWHFLGATSTTQPSLWSAEQLTAQRCPPPKVLEAKAHSATEFLVRFDRSLAVGSLDGSGAQFTVDGLAITGATLQSPREVLVTTTPQTPRGSYVTEVSATLRDLKGDGVQPPHHTASFRGFAPPARLRITELAPNMPLGRDLVELVVLQAGPVTGMTLMLDAGPLPLATFPDVDVQAGDILVMHLNPDASGSEAGPRSELSGPAEHPQGVYPATHDTAWDFHSGNTFSLLSGNRVLRVLDPFGVPQDGLALILPGNSFPGYLSDLVALQAEGQWRPASCGGDACTYFTSPSAWDISINWSPAFVSPGKQTTLGRVASGDSDAAGDWAVGMGTMGASGP